MYQKWFRTGPINGPKSVENLNHKHPKTGSTIFQKPGPQYIQNQGRKPYKNGAKKVIVLAENATDAPRGLNIPSGALWPVCAFESAFSDVQSYLRTLFSSILSTKNPGKCDRNIRGQVLLPARVFRKWRTHFWKNAARDMEPKWHQTLLQKWLGIHHTEAAIQR